VPRSEGPIKSATLPWVSKLDNDELLLQLNLRIYSLDAVSKTCYLFTDRCYLFISEDTPTTLNIRFAPIRPDVDLNTLVGEFCNELLNQNLRHLITAETRTVRDLIVAQAFAEADLLENETPMENAPDQPREE
jgi:His-Xaa-Ser system protein HxsD